MNRPEEDEGDEWMFDAFDDDLDLTGENSDDGLDPDDDHALNGYYANSVPVYKHRNADEED